MATIVAQLKNTLKKVLDDESVVQMDYLVGLLKYNPTNLTQFYNDRLTVGAASSLTFDVNGEKNSLGDDLNFTKFFVIFIKYLNATGGDLIVNSDEDIGLFENIDNGIVVQAGGTYLLVNPVMGWTLPSSSFDLTLNNQSAEEVQVDISILGQ